MTTRTATERALQQSRLDGNRWIGPSVSQRSMSVAPPTLRPVAAKPLPGGFECAWAQVAQPLVARGDPLNDIVQLNTASQVTWLVFRANDRDSILIEVPRQPTVVDAARAKAAAAGMTVQDWIAQAVDGALRAKP